MSRSHRSRRSGGDRVPGFEMDRNMGRRTIDDTSYVVRKTTDLAIGAGAITLGVGALGAIGTVLKK